MHAIGTSSILLTDLNLPSVITAPSKSIVKCWLQTTLDGNTYFKGFQLKSLIGLILLGQHCLTDKATKQDD